jgi:hypothetical protein
VDEKPDELLAKYVPHGECSRVAFMLDPAVVVAFEELREDISLSRTWASCLP